MICPGLAAWRDSVSASPQVMALSSGVRFSLLVATCTGLLPVCSSGQLDPYSDLTRHHIRVQDLPQPYETGSVSNPPRVVPRPDGALLAVPAGFVVQEVAAGLEQPRIMALAANGDIFVAESKAGRVTVLRDVNGDGVFDKRWIFAADLERPFGIAFIGEWIYIATTPQVVRFPFSIGDTSTSGTPEAIINLPDTPFFQHWTRNLLYHPKEDKLYISVGSKGNIAEEEPHRAAVLRCDPDGKNLEIFASGLRNPVGLALEPVTGAVWTSVNERDGLGDDLVPDYATHLQPGGFYGWPYSYLGANPQPGYGEKRPDLADRAIVPDVLFQAHSAALGMTFYTHDRFPLHFRNGAFVAFHGSWNRKNRTGYKVVYLPFAESGYASGYYEDFATGWSDTPSGKTVWGRPVDVLVDDDGSLLISDDGNNKIWRVRYGGP